MWLFFELLLSSFVFFQKYKKSLFSTLQYSRFVNLNIKNCIFTHVNREYICVCKPIKAQINMQM